MPRVYRNISRRRYAIPRASGQPPATRVSRTTTRTARIPLQVKSFIGGKPEICGRSMRIAISGFPPPWSVDGDAVPDKKINAYANGVSTQSVK